MEIVLSFIFAVALFLALVAFFSSFFTVKTAEVAIITRFGKFLRIAEPGLNWKVPFIDKVTDASACASTRSSLTMETKTKDNVFVTIPISVQNPGAAGKSL